jgi:endoglucanase
VKIIIKSTLLFFWINFGLIATLSTFSVQLKAQDLPSVQKNLGAGINVSLLEQYWKSPEQLYAADINDKLKKIAKQGFKTVRLPVAFDLFLQPQSSNLQIRLISKLNDIYTACIAKNLNLIITYHYGKLNDKNTNNEIDRISWMWKQIQRNFSGKGYNNLFFDLYNEPTLTPYQWKETITTIIRYLRYEDANRIYIVGGTNYNNLEQLKQLGKLPDEKILYTFHFYEPFIFTHQGAEWTNNKSFITDIPFPYQKNRMPGIIAELKGSSVERDYNKYPYEGTAAYLNERCKSIAEFCSAKNMPLICTETGVISTADKTYRENYLKEVTNAMQQNNIPCLLWDWDDRFSIKKNDRNVLDCLKHWIKQNR